MRRLALSLAALATACAHPLDYEEGGPGDEVLIAEGQALHETASPGTQLIYLNFDGVRVDDCGGYCSDAPGNRSWAIGAHFGRGSLTFAPYRGGASAERRIVSILEDAYAPYDVHLTTERPSSGPYTMLIVSPTSGPNHGVAPLDCQNRNASDIAFVYRIGDSSPEWIAQAAAHELGHSFGLGHVSGAGDFMQWAASGRRFTRSSYDTAHPSGKCFDGNTQDAPGMLREALGEHYHGPPVFDGTFADDDGNTHEADIERLYAAGVTVGCAGGEAPRYCPGDSVTRGQMAVFLQRAMGLRSSGVDHFTDDDGTYWEDAANAIADRGVTRGCGERRFCGSDPVTRRQMASFLARALSLPAASADYFDDDAGDIHEADINRLAESGITRGCGARRYCPTEPVTRAQMASFLVRAFDL